MIFSQARKGSSAFFQEQTGGCLPHSYGLILGSQKLDTMILVGPFQSQILCDSVMPRDLRLIEQSRRHSLRQLWLWSRFWEKKRSSWKVRVNTESMFVILETENTL